MQDKTDGKIKYFGADFTEIDRYIGNTVIESKNYSDILTEKKEDILLKFLEEVKDTIDSIQINGPNESLYKFIDGGIRFQGLVGVVSYPFRYQIYNNGQIKNLNLNITIEIHSRFDTDKEGGLSKPYFLAAMLRQSNELKTTGNEIEENPNDYFFDFLLVFRFASCLKTAYEKGYYRTYQRFEKNDDRLKGAIDIARHIKENMGLSNGRIAYSYREKTVNNYFNHLLLETYFFIKDKFNDLFSNILEADEMISRMIQQLKSDIDYPLYGIKEVIAKNMSPISHPFYLEYEELREVCLKILRDEGTSVFEGTESEVEGILYYIPELWEKFLQLYLEDTEDYYIISQFGLKIFDFNNDKNFRHNTRPDYVFFADSTKKNPFMILDAKFKPAWAVLIKNDEWDKHLDEDYNKCIRDMNSLNTHYSGIICPSRYELEENQAFEHSISRYNMTDKFYTFPIYVPEVSNNEKYEIWEKKFMESTEGIMEKIKEIIHSKKSGN